MNGPLLAGLGFLALGGIITGATYASADPGGMYVVTTGLFVVGGLNLLRGIALQVRINKARREFDPFRNRLS